MKIFLTGATGCLGGNIVDYILNNTDYNLVIGVRKSSNVSRFKNLNVEIRVLNFYNSKEVLEAIPPDVDAVIHCAGNVSYQTFEKRKQNLDNITVTKNIIKAIKTINNKIRLIHCSTIAVDSDNIKSNYSKSKKIAENEVIKSGLEYIILRPYVIIGQYDTKNYFNVFKTLKDEKYPYSLPNRVEFCDVQELAKAYVNAASKPYTDLSKIYNLGGINSSWLDGSILISRLLQVKPPKKVIPKVLLYILGVYGEIKNRIFHKHADLNFEFIDLLYKTRPEIDIVDKIKSKQDLDYNYDIDLEILFLKYINWVTKETLF